MSSETATTQPASEALASEDGKRRLSAILVLAFGAFLVWGAAYANPITLHNAAHDVRHATGFPCH